jgi:type II secretory pathway pseudopilin PulG
MERMLQRMTRKNRGLTLVEVLVVNGVVMVIAGIVITAAVASRGSARAASCTSNLRQYPLHLRTRLSPNLRTPEGCRPEANTTRRVCGGKPQDEGMAVAES